MDQKTYDEMVAEQVTSEMFPNNEQKEAEIKEPAQVIESLTNPRLLDIGYRKNKANPYAMKAYFPVIGKMVAPVPCRTATEALSKARDIWLQMCADYDKALEMTSSSPAVTEEEQVVEAQG